MGKLRRRQAVSSVQIVLIFTISTVQTFCKFCLEIYWQFPYLLHSFVWLPLTCLFSPFMKPLNFRIEFFLDTPYCFANITNSCYSEETFMGKPACVSCEHLKFQILTYASLLNFSNVAYNCILFSSVWRKQDTFTETRGRLREKRGSTVASPALRVRSRPAFDSQ